MNTNLNSKTSSYNPLEAVARAKERLLVLKREAEERLAKQEQDLQAARIPAAASVLSPTLLAAAPTTVIEIQAPATFATSGWLIDSSRPWNPQQLQAIDSALTGKSFCLIGAAGTGKTSTLKGAVNSLIANGLVPVISPEQSTKRLKAGTLGVVLCSFTNMAVRQIAKHFSKDINCLTIHKLLEYAPVYYEVENDDGTKATTMRFEPSRNRYNKLPRSIKTIVVDEGSMVDEALVLQIVDALPDPASVQWIFLGDLNQLPPVYGNPILGKKLLELPIIELTHVYRQALLSPIITLATKLTTGETVNYPLAEGKQIIDAGENGKLTVFPWSKSISADDALSKAANYAKAAINEGLFDIYSDMILIPFNVSFGTVELNLAIADWLGRQREAEVIEIIAGFNKHYYAIGDKVLVDKREAIITKISRNQAYGGKRAINPAIYTIDRHGGARKKAHPSGLAAGSSSSLYEEENTFDVDALLESMVAGQIEDRARASSHAVTVRFLNGAHPPKDWTPEDEKLYIAGILDDEEFDEHILSAAGEINAMLFAYALTIHKSQGSEWQRVIAFFHQSHAVMCFRELLYTCITRASKELVLVVEGDKPGKAGTLNKASKNPRLQGNNLAEKLVSLKARFTEAEAEKTKKLIASVTSNPSSPATLYN